MRNLPSRKPSLWKKLLYTVAVASIMFGLLWGSSTLSPAMANTLSKIPLIGSIFNTFGDSGLVKVSKNELSKQLGASETINNKTVTIKEVYFDDTRLTISYQFESDKPIPEDYLEHSYMINGEEKAGTMRIDNEEVSPKHWVGFLSIETFQEELPEETQIGVTFEGKEGEVWEFTEQVTKQITKMIEGIDYNNKKEGLNISINKITYGSGGILLKYSSNEQKYNLQNSVKFKVIDSYGKELKQLDGVLADDLGKNLYEPIGEGVTDLIITPYIELLPNDIQSLEKLSQEKIFEKNKIVFEPLKVEL